MISFLLLFLSVLLRYIRHAAQYKFNNLTYILYDITTMVSEHCGCSLNISHRYKMFSCIENS